MPSRQFQAGIGYRYGFQGQEKDDEIKGAGNSVNYKYRIHDPRLGRFFNLDPLASKFPHNSPYAFSENRVIDAIELEGLESYPLNPSGGLHNVAYAFGKLWDGFVNMFTIHSETGKAKVRTVNYGFTSITLRSEQFLSIKVDFSSLSTNANNELVLPELSTLLSMSYKKQETSSSELTLKLPEGVNYSVGVEENMTDNDMSLYQEVSIGLDNDVASAKVYLRQQFKKDENGNTAESYTAGGELEILIKVDDDGEQTKVFARGGATLGEN